MSGEVKKLPKPNVNFRYPSLKYVTSRSYWIYGMGIILAGAYKYYYAVKWPKLYDDYYKTYDHKAECQRYKDLGIFQCVNADPDDYQ